VRVSLLHLPGVLAVTYHRDQDYFTVRYESVLVSPENIFAAVLQVAKQMARKFSPEIIDNP
jgi:hypothetical protein